MMEVEYLKQIFYQMIHIENFSWFRKTSDKVFVWMQELFHWSFIRGTILKCWVSVVVYVLTLWGLFIIALDYVLAKVTHRRSICEEQILILLIQ